MTGVAVVVPTVDRVALLDRCLRGLAAQGAGEFEVEVVVVHDGRPVVRELLTGWAPHLPLREVDAGVSGAATKRNAGWRAATAPWVAFTDDDCEPAPGWLAALRAATADGAGVVAGPVRPHPDDAGVTGPWARTVHCEEPGLYPGCNLLVARAALERVGGFDAALPAGEDTDLAWRVIEDGWAAAWAPQAVVWHAVRPVSYPAHLRSLPRWSALPLVLRRHPQLRRYAHRRVFWKGTHPVALLALAGLLGAAVDRRLLWAAAPLAWRRVRGSGVRAGAALAVSDMVEVGVMLVGSARYRSMLL